VNRPRCHVTAPSGWINDPLGVTWHRTPEGAAYELFVQHVPGATEWTPACTWGQLTSPDLVRWQWVGTALSPGDGEAGCWSGSVAVGDDGVPVIFYTSVRAGSLALGAINRAVGEPSWREWTADPEPVIPGPPPGLTHFRDPHVRRDGSGWRMVVGGGRDDGRAGGRPIAVQYSSPDLRRWTLDGVLAEADGPGSVWECAQLVRVDGAWVLLVSVWDDGSPQHVAYAVGELDGDRFTPGPWRRFTATDAVYATTTFPDAAGRTCAISWVREPGAPGTEWAGVLSLPVVLGRDGDRLLLAPHPDVDGLRTAMLADTSATDAGGADGDVLGPFEPFLDIEVDLAAEPARLAVGDLLTLDAGAAGPVLKRPGRPDQRLPASGRVRLLLDAELAEVFAGGDVAVVRVDPAAGPVAVSVQGVRRITVHALSR
jgi:beta-fructofuranosidase